MAESEQERAQRLLDVMGQNSDDWFDWLSHEDQRFLCHDLLPSIRRHGCYPPPPAGTVAITKNLPNPVREFVNQVVE